MLQAMCLAWLSQLMGVTVVHAPLRHWLKLFYASMCTFVLFGLDQVCSLCMHLLIDTKVSCTVDCLI